MEFSERLKMLRCENNMTQKDVAKIIHVQPTSIANYESGRNRAPYTKLKKLADYFEIPIEYLLGDSDNVSSLKDDDESDEDLKELYDIYSSLEDNKKKEVKDFMKWLAHKNK